MTSDIRKKISLLFDDSTFTSFCQDYYFFVVYNEFSQGMRKDEKIRLLLDHCHRERTGFQTLLDSVRQEYESSKPKRQELSPLIDALEAYLNSLPSNKNNKKSRKKTKKVNLQLNLQSGLNPEHIASIIKKNLLKQQISPSTDDVGQVLRTLFHDATAIYPTLFLSSERRLSHTLTDPVLILVKPCYEGVWVPPVVVKFSSRKEIEREAHNHRVMQRYLRGQSWLPLLSGVAYSGQIGGLVYTLIEFDESGPIYNLDEIFTKEDTKYVSEMIKNIINRVYRVFDQYSKEQPINLTTTYANAFGLTAQDLRQAVTDFHPDVLDHKLSVRFRELSEKFRNPMTWVLSDDGFHDFETFSKYSLCHGNLHSSNILVDAKNRFWLIGFAQVEESHALRDFAQLETDIKFNLLPESNLEDLLSFEKALLAPTKFQDQAPDSSFKNSKIEHAYRVVLALRQQMAVELIQMKGNMDEYYQALFWHALNIICLGHIKDEKKEHALLSAALLCQRLDEWPKWEILPATIPPTKDHFPNQPVTKEPNYRDRLVGAALFLLVVVLLWWAISYFDLGGT